jgi:hypothetical protein
MLASVVKDYPQFSAAQFDAPQDGPCSHALFKADGAGGLTAAKDQAFLAENGLAAYMIEVPAGSQALVSFEPLGWPLGECPEPYLTRILGDVFPYGKKVLPYRPATGAKPPQTLLITFTGFGRISLMSPSEHSSIDLRRYASATETMTVAVCLRQVAGGLAVIRRVGAFNSPTVDVADAVVIPAAPQSGAEVRSARKSAAKGP